LTVSRQKKQFLYKEGDAFNFMDMNTYEQISVQPQLLGNLVNYLKENLEVDAVYLESELIGMEMPAIIEMTILQADPGIKGDTVSNMTKMAKLETGADIKVPLFIKEGDKIKVDTRTGEYVERV
jgi:elongation factor P